MKTFTHGDKEESSRLTATEISRLMQWSDMHVNRWIEDQRAMNQQRQHMEEMMNLHQRWLERIYTRENV